MFSSLVLEAVVICFKLGIEPVAIRSKLGIGACCNTFKAWY